MLLPTTDIKWPPPPYDIAQRKYQEYSAWYGGEPYILASQYIGGGSKTITAQTTAEHSFLPRPAQFAGGLIGSVARFFWGTPPSVGNTYTAKMHIPLAEEIAAEGSYQLFKNPPSIDVIGSPAHQVRIEQYIKRGLFVKLSEGAEIAAALTGVFFRVGYETSLSDQPIVSVIHPDAAVPTFNFGFLTEVIFWRTLSDKNNRVYRHLERHTVGMLEHALYLGDLKTIGKRVPLTEQEETANLQELNDTGLDILDCVYVPNLKTRLWRDKNQICNLGRSDYGSILPIMDGLDETYTSWMRDIRLGKARLLVPQDYLESVGRGKGAIFDLDRDVFVGLNALTDGAKLEITPNQFNIRFEAHAATTAALMERCMSGAGYSAQTFGLTTDVAMTATETDARERRTFDTRDAKIETGWKRETAKLVEIMLSIDAYLGAVTVLPLPLEIEVEFPPPVRDNLKTIADTVKTFRDARAMSTAVAVALIHPEWDDARINAEVALIDRSNAPIITGS
ncbi:MAG: hypothetical protein ACREOZ_02180 [Gloeomargaritales cyanobacterium]